MELEVKKPNNLEDGKHEGIITALEERSKPFDYLDILIESDGRKVKVGYPKTVMMESKLGLLLRRFGGDLKEGSKVDPEKILVGKKCSFIVMNEKTDRGTFPKVIPESLKPNGN